MDNESVDDNFTRPAPSELCAAAPCTFALATKAETSSSAGTAFGAVVRALHAYAVRHRTSIMTARTLRQQHCSTTMRTVLAEVHSSACMSDVVASKLRQWNGAPTRVPWDACLPVRR